MLEYIYIHGPRWLGSWEGIAKADICAGLTKVPAALWSVDVNAPECAALISRHVRAAGIGFATIATSLVMWTSLQAWANSMALRYIIQYSK